MARKDRKPKQFIDSKDDALKLAQSVAATQEDISKKKVERHTQLAGTSKTAPAPASHKKSKSKDKLKQVKAALASEAAKAKREKANARKRAKAGKQDAPADDTDSRTHGGKPTEPSARPRKRVNFAD